MVIDSNGDFLYLTSSGLSYRIIFFLNGENFIRDIGYLIFDVEDIDCFEFIIEETLWE